VYASASTSQMYIGLQSVMDPRIKATTVAAAASGFAMEDPQMDAKIKAPTVRTHTNTYMMEKYR
jgi:hypothetical protein